MRNIKGIAIRDYKQVLADLQRILGPDAGRIINELTDYIVMTISSSPVVDFGRFRLEQKGGRIYFVIKDFEVHDDSLDSEELFVV
ncbi:MAG: hypothetical protein QW706_09720 [Candidatus Nezhaarchaeales archaeon]